MSAPITSNDAKYAEAESNPVLRALMGRLYAEVQRRVDNFAPESLLDAGCGEGHAFTFLTLPSRYQGIDANPVCVAHCRAMRPDADVQEGSVYALRQADASVDVVMCLEVLEHLDEPGAGLRELCRVAGRGVVLSVPFEPVFQLGNALRGKYRSTWGNHPEHVQHWGIRSFRRFLVGSGVLDEVSVSVAGPWLVASGRPRPR